MIPEGGVKKVRELLKVERLLAGVAEHKVAQLQVAVLVLQHRRRLFQNLPLEGGGGVLFEPFSDYKLLPGTIAVPHITK